MCCMVLIKNKGASFFHEIRILTYIIHMKVLIDNFNVVSKENADTPF